MVFFLQHRQELLHLKDHVVVTEAASEGTGGGSIWSTSKHGRATYRDPVFTEKGKTQTRKFGGTCLLRGGRKVSLIVSQERILKVSF